MVRTALTISLKTNVVGMSTHSSAVLSGTRNPSHIVSLEHGTRVLESPLSSFHLFIMNLRYAVLSVCLSVMSVRAAPRVPRPCCVDHRFQAVMGEVGGSIRRNGSPVVLDVRIAIDSFFFLFFFTCMYVCMY